MTDTAQGTRVQMPKLGESVTEGTIAGWLIKIGDYVDRYDPIVEVITDKVNAEVPAPVSGTILELLSQEGDVVPVGEAIAVIDEGTGTATVLQEVPVEQTEEVAESDTVSESQPLTSATRQPAIADIENARAERDEIAMLQIRSSPLVRRLAAEHDIDLGSISGSGIGGRVTKTDIEAVIAAPAPTPEIEVMPASGRQQETRVPPAASTIQLMPGDEIVEATHIRKQVAEHMTRSAYTAPQVTTWMEADMTRIVAIRERLKDEFLTREGFGLTYLPFVLEATTRTLREMPQVNACWDDGNIVLRHAINVGIAVALEDGLIVPVVKNADSLNLTGLAREANEVINRVRENRLQPDDVQGGTFTLNNPGTLGSILSTPMLVQPQAGILSMEAIVKRPVVVDDMIAIRSMMNMSMTIDHRILDGLVATRFLAAVKDKLENYPDNTVI